MADVVRLNKPAFPLRNHARGMLDQAISCAIEHDAVAAVVVLIDAEGEEFFFISDDAECEAMLRAVDITRKVVRDKVKNR